MYCKPFAQLNCYSLKFSPTVVGEPYNLKIYVLIFKYVHIQIIPVLNSKIQVPLVYFDFTYYFHISFKGLSESSSPETQVSFTE